MSKRNRWFMGAAVVAALPLAISQAHAQQAAPAAAPQAATRGAKGFWRLWRTVLRLHDRGLSRGPASTGGER